MVAPRATVFLGFATRVCLMRFLLAFCFSVVAKGAEDSNLSLETCVFHLPNNVKEALCMDTSIILCSHSMVLCVLLFIRTTLSIFAKVYSILFCPAVQVERS